MRSPNSPPTSYSDTEDGDRRWSRAAATAGLADHQRAPGRPPHGRPGQQEGLTSPAPTASRSTPRPASTVGQRARQREPTVRLNNRLRRSVDAAIGSADAASRPISATRLQAAQSVFKSHEETALEAVDGALAKEDQQIRQGCARRRPRGDPAVQARRHRGREARGGRHRQGRAAIRRRWRCCTGMAPTSRPR